MGERTHPPDRTPRPGARGRRLLLAGGLILALVLGYLARSAGPAENTPGRGLAPSVTPAPARLLPPSAARTSASRARSPTQLPAPLRPAADPTALTPTSPPTIPAALAGP
ncbi:MAG TPA: hypothetical protein VKY74_11200, partial [Chloroflexia bacterium]|nr:hypothetical protein [Chloroflexia bacterium]